MLLAVRNTRLRNLHGCLGIQAKSNSLGSNAPNSAVCPSPPRCLLAGTDRRRGSDRCSALHLVISATLCEARPSAWKIERTGEWCLPLPPNHPIAATGLLRAHCHLKCAAGTPLNRSYVTIIIAHPLPARSSLRQLYLRLPTCTRVQNGPQTRSLSAVVHHVDEPPPLRHGKRCCHLSPSAVCS